MHQWQFTPNHVAIITTITLVLHRFAARELAPCRIVWVGQRDNCGAKRVLMADTTAGNRHVAVPEVYGGGALSYIAIVRLSVRLAV